MWTDPAEGMDRALGLQLPDEIVKLVDAGAIFYISSSGGKDSQAMDLLLSAAIPHDQIVLVHASLGEVEWPGTIEHIRNTSPHDLNIVQAKKTFFEMVEARGKWPSAQFRTCTSDLKVSVIHQFIRSDLRSKGKVLGVNCTGIRAQESSARSKKNPLTINRTLSVAGRTVLDWMPIFDLPADEVFQTIAASCQSPHYAYALGNGRLSCVFCILGSRSDIKNGAVHNPGLYRKYVRLERQIGHTIFFKNGRPYPLTDVTGIPA